MFCSCMHNEHTKQHVKPHDYCFSIFWQQVWSVSNRNKLVQEMLRNLIHFKFDCQMYKMAAPVPLVNFLII